jgi:hypothetical protein
VPRAASVETDLGAFAGVPRDVSKTGDAEPAQPAALRRNLRRAAKPSTEPLRHLIEIGGEAAAIDRDPDRDKEAADQVAPAQCDRSSASRARRDRQTARSDNSPRACRRRDSIDGSVFVKTPRTAMKMAGMS